MLSSGVKALFNESLNILQMEQTVSKYMLSLGSVVLITSGLGLIASTSKKEYLAYFVSEKSILVRHAFTWHHAFVHNSWVCNTCLPHSNKLRNLSRLRLDYWLLQ
jgi:hypothetical protein